MFVNIFSGGLAGILLWIVFWFTIIVSGMIFLLSLCNAYNTMLNKFSIMVWLVRFSIVRSKKDIVSYQRFAHVLFANNVVQYFKFQERGYILLSLLLYVIATILSFVVWGASAVSIRNIKIDYIFTKYLKINTN